MRYANLAGADLRGANLLSANLTEICLLRAKFDDVKLDSDSKISISDAELTVSLATSNSRDRDFNHINNPTSGSILSAISSFSDRAMRCSLLDGAAKAMLETINTSGPTQNSPDNIVKELWEPLADSLFSHLDYTANNISEYPHYRELSKRVFEEAFLSEKIYRVSKKENLRQLRSALLDYVREHLEKNNAQIQILSYPSSEDSPPVQEKLQDIKNKIIEMPFLKNLIQQYEKDTFASSEDRVDTLYLVSPDREQAAVLNANYVKHYIKGEIIPNPPSLDAFYVCRKNAQGSYNIQTNSPPPQQL